MKRAGARLALAMVVAGSVATAPVSAQYFGRNKVQYHHFEFQVLKTPAFDVYYYPSEREGVDAAARMAERWNARLARIFDYSLRDRQPLVLYASHLDFEQTNIISGELGEGTGGVTEPLRRRIILPLAGALADTDHVIGHELVHAFQYDITGPANRRADEYSLHRLPLWFVEGMAEYLSLGPVDANTAMWLRDAVQQRRLPAIEDLQNPRYFPYRWGQAFWAYVGGRWGDAIVGPMLATAVSPGGVRAAIEQVLLTNEKTLSEEWHRAIEAQYAPILAAATPPDRIGRVLIKAEELKGDLNVGPSLSPDGKWMTFLSNRNFVAIDLYLADATSGRVVRRLTSTAADPHFSSLQFIYSAGGWDRASRRVALAAVAGGHPALAIFDASSGEQVQEVKIEAVDEILNPTWAPDGHAIAFTGMIRGLTDLFVYDLRSARLGQVTSDAFTDLQPAWSPDGRRIAFATDRFTTNLATLSTGALRIALVDPESGSMAAVRAFDAGKHINPQWAPDGRSLYFIGDPDGIPNLYRVDLATSAVSPLTRAGTGISGITSTSPAAAVALEEGTIAVTVYRAGGYEICRLDSGVAPVEGSPMPGGAADLPPATRTSSEVAGMLANAEMGAVDPARFTSEPYKSTLGLEAIGQPTAGVGVSQFGTSFGGGMSLYFGDMLENHLLATAVQVNGGLTGEMSVNDIGAEVAYLDRERRWNLGVSAGQFPYLSGAFQYRVEEVPGGDLIETDQLILYRQTERAASGIAAYPFDRARRLQFQGGVGHISFERIVRTTSYSLYTGTVYGDSRVSTKLAESLTLGTASAAYVFDAASFGATSPIHGQRYRIEASPAFGTINFTNLLFDYRRYLMPVPFYTFALRGLHYGRYGSDAEDVRLYPMYIGYPSLVRGYDAATISASECLPVTTSSCPTLDRLLGSRMLVGNAELRFPLLRPFGLSRSMYGPIPVETALFADAGVAWSRGETPRSAPGVWSAGVAFRVNILGVMVGEFDLVRPFQRPRQGWIFTFNLLPGW